MHDLLCIAVSLQCGVSWSTVNAPAVGVHTFEVLTFVCRRRSKCSLPDTNDLATVAPKHVCFVAAVLVPFKDVLVTTSQATYWRRSTNVVSKNPHQFNPKDGPWLSVVATLSELPQQVPAKHWPSSCPQSSTSVLRYVVTSTCSCCICGSDFNCDHTWHSAGLSQTW